MRKVSFALLLAAAGAAAPAQAQLPVPLSVEGRAGAAFPVGDFADGVKTGLTLGASATVGVAPGFGVYGSYNHTQFDLDGAAGKLVDSGFSAGVTASLPAVSPAVAPYLGAGVVVHGLDYDPGDDRDEVDLGETDVGFEVGAGLAVTVAPRVRLTPAVGYRRYGAELPAVVGSVDGDVSYMTLGIGLNIGF